MCDPHQLAQQRSLSFHRVVAQRLEGDPEILRAARERIHAWLAAGNRSSEHLRQWGAILEGMPESIAEFLVEDSPRARELRQSTPFAGALSPRERWRIWREVRDRHRALP